MKKPSHALAILILLCWSLMATSTRSFSFSALPFSRFSPPQHLLSTPSQIQQYQLKRNEWAHRYTSLEELRKTFGENRNKLWGDLDPDTSRRLYKCLLPRALLELYNLGVHPTDLAPLAYRARVAAKLYARERCVLPARVASYLFDGFRQWKKYGQFDMNGMTYQQVWDKYENLILEEIAEDDSYGEEDVTAKICLKILEKSCTTNERIDRLVMRESHEERQEIDYVKAQLEKDVRDLLQPNKPPKRMNVKVLRNLVKIKRRLDGLSSNKAAEDNELKQFKAWYPSQPNIGRSGIPGEKDETQLIEDTLATGGFWAKQ